MVACGLYGMPESRNFERKQHYRWQRRVIRAGKRAQTSGIVKLEHAIMDREAGNNPISDEEFERDIKEIVDLLKQVR